MNKYIYIYMYVHIYTYILIYIYTVLFPAIETAYFPLCWHSSKNYYWHIKLAILSYFLRPSEELTFGQPSF